MLHIIRRGNIRIEKDLLEKSNCESGQIYRREHNAPHNKARQYKNREGLIRKK